MSDQQKDIPVRVSSMYGAKTREALVTLVIGDQMHQIRASEARVVGALLIDVAGASEADAFLFEFMRERVGADVDRAGQMLMEFRAWRKGKTNE